MPKYRMKTFSNAIHLYNKNSLLLVHSFFHRPGGVAWTDLPRKPFNNCHAYAVGAFYLKLSTRKGGYK